MKTNIIMAVMVAKRNDAAPEVQKILTEYGCIIDSRLGLHKIQDCADKGLIILHLLGEEKEIMGLERNLEKQDAVQINKMKIDF